MDYSHSPFVEYLVGAVAILMGVLVVAMVFLMFRRPRPEPPAAPPDAPPPKRRGSGPGAGGDPGELG
jgi:hypothetical protein